MNYRYGLGELRDEKGFPILDEKKKPIKGNTKLLLLEKQFNCYICGEEANTGFANKRCAIHEGEELRPLTAQAWDDWRNLCKWLKFCQSKEFFTKSKWRMLPDGHLYCDDCIENGE